MNAKKFILTSIVVFIVYEILNYLIHGFILMDAYAATASLWRPEAEMNSMMWIMWVVDLIKAFVFVFIFTKGIEGKGWMEGLRYGFWIGLYVSLGMGFGMYATSPIPFSLALQWFIYGVIQLMICGVATALMYKTKK
jgi:hypothetical protein